MILVTGVSGFLGSHIFSALQTEFGHDQIVALTSSPVLDGNYVLHNNYCVSPDFAYENGLGFVETVVHAGAFTPKSGAMSNSVFECNSNIESTTKLFHSMLPSVEKTIFLSTLDVYQPSGKLLTESSPEGPSSLYGQSKLYCEKVIEEWAKSKNAICQILRIGHVYGPGEESYRKVIPATMENLLQGKSPVVYGDGEDMRSFIYVSDVVGSVVSAIKQPGSLGVVNVAGGSPVSMVELVRRIIAISGTDSKISYVESKAPSRHIVFDNTRLKELLYTPVVGLDEGLSREWTYMKGRPQ